MHKDKKAGIDELLDRLDPAKVRKTYNIAADLAELKESLGMFRGKELARKIDALIEKYTTGEMAEVHEALVARCRAGRRLRHPAVQRAAAGGQNRRDGE